MNQIMISIITGTKVTC